MSLRDDFARWRDDPMTQHVLSALERAEKAQKQAWDEASWGGQVVRSPDLENTLRELRTRADAYRALIDLTFEDVAAWLELETDAE